MYLFEKSADSIVKKRTLPTNQPAVWPTVLQVEPQETFSLKKKFNLNFRFLNNLILGQHG